MKSKGNLKLALLIFTLSGLSEMSLTCSAREVMTKLEAYETMKKNGFKWKETTLLDQDAQAKVELASSQFYPVINVITREFTGRLNPIQYGGIDTSSVSWFTAGQTAMQIYYGIYEKSDHDRADAADWYQKKNAAERDSFRNDLTFLMLSQYLTVQKLKKKIQVSEAGIQRGEELNKIAKLRIASGSGVKLDLLHAQTLLKYEQMKRSELQNSYEHAIHLLAMTLGKESLEKEIEPLQVSSFELPRQEKTWIEAQVHKRPDLQKLRFLTKMHESLSDSISHERWPKLTFIGDAGVIGSTSPLGVGREFNGTFGFQLSLPIFNLSIGARETQSLAQKTRAELESSAQELQARAEVKQAMSQITQAKKTLELSQHQLAAVQEELQISSRKFSAGTMSGFEYSTARNAFIEAQSANIEVMYMVEMAKAFYFKTIAKFDQYFELERKRGGSHHG